MRPLPRRTVLRGVGGVTVALPFLEAMLQSARAQTAARPPRRLVFVFSPGGYLLDQWKCDIAGTESRSFTLSRVLSEFESVRDKALFIEGVPMTSAEDPRTPAGGHPQGNTALLTGAFAGPGGDYGGCGEGCTVGPPESESVDQYLARTVGQATRFPAVYAGAFTPTGVVSKTVFYGRNQALISPQGDPRKLFDTLFSSYSQTQQVAQQRLEERQLVLSRVLDQYKKLRCRLGAQDRQRMEQHLEEISALSRRLALPTSPGNACQVPSAPPTFNVPQGQGVGSFSQLPQVLAAQIDLVAMALACDVTRIVGLMIHGPDMDGLGSIYSWLGHDQIWHEITHLMGTTPEARIEQTTRWYAKQILALVNKLKGMVEADGSTVFDNTAIVWITEVAQGWNHQVDDMPWTIVGDGRGYFSTGKYLKFGNTPDVRHNRLLVHLVNYMGLNDAGFGHPDYQGSPLPGIRA